MQECLIRIWRACSSDREVDSPVAYAEQLVASVLIDLARKRRAAQRTAGGRARSPRPRSGPPR